MKKKLILVAGGSCAGKTTFANSLVKQFLDRKVEVISMDGYFNDYSGYDENDLARENFDIPEAFNLRKLIQDISGLLAGRDMRIPEYDFINRKCARSNKVTSDFDYLVVEGIFALFLPVINELSSLRVFIHTDLDLMLIRRILRDTSERNFDFHDVIERYLNFVKPSYKELIQPTKSNANVIMDGAVPFDFEQIEEYMD